MLQAHRTGTPFMLKDELIAAAEASKLADLPIQGNTNNWAAARGAAKWYDGWSNIKTLENRDVPLIQRWSNPKKVRLTSAGITLAATLYRHAVESGRMQPHPEYLVKWKGYGDEYNEWRDEVGVTAAATDEYWVRVGGRSAPPPHLRKKRRGLRSGAAQQRVRTRRRSAAAAMVTRES
eukprot:gene12005-12149_t